jgi:hypothetical protein
MPVPLLTEAAWMRQVTDLARIRGWKLFHPHWSMHSEPGWPDLALVRTPRFVLSELKTDRPSSKLTAKQEEWLELLRTIPGIEVYVWRPSDFDDMREVLW